MITDTSKKIVSFIKQNRSVKPIELVAYLGLSRQAIFRQLKKLTTQEILVKSGMPPNVFYSLKEDVQVEQESILDQKISKIVEKNYLFITSSGDFLSGLQGFAYWCKKNQLPLDKTAQEYVEVLNKYANFRDKKTSLISGLVKFRQAFVKVFIDQVYYLDFYSLERFGKTKLGLLLLYAKQSQNKELINKIFQIIQKPVLDLISLAHIDAVSFVPPTINRKIQLQKELEKMFAFHLPRVNIVKINNKIIVPQKTLNKLQDRIDNIDKTVFIDENKTFNNILLIDDAVGSGATLNQIAKKIREKKLVRGKIIGLALTGSFKGFDVISEV